MKWFPGINLNHSAFRLIIWSAIISFSVPILALAVNGSFSRYMADDFATAFTLHTQGFWRMQQYWYTTWSGRYAFFFVIAVLEKLGPWLVPYLPALALAAMLAGFYLILLPALQFFEVRHANAIAVSLSTLVVFVAFSQTPNVVQSLYWQTGVITYVLPVIVFIFYLAVVSRQFFTETRPVPSAVLVAAFLLQLISGGFSESFTAFQGVFLFLLLFTSIISPKGSRGRRVLPLALAGFLATLIAVVIIFASPGNEFRQAGLPPAPGIRITIKESVSLTEDFFGQTLSRDTVNALLLLLWPALMLYSALGKDRIGALTSNWMILLQLVAVPIIGFGFIALCYAPPYYAFSAPPPDRLLIIPHLIFSAMLCVMGLLAGSLLRRKFTPAPMLARALALVGLIFLGAALLLGPIRSGRSIARQMPQLRQFSLDWDARQQILQAARLNGQTAAVVPKVINISGLDDVGPDPYNWWNQTIAGYYGLVSIRIEE